MKKDKNTLPLVLPSKGILRKFFRAFYSITNFTKASVLSLVVLGAILVLLTEMEQAFTMLLKMVEEDKFSLFFCFIMVYVLALGFSHFPVYTYFAGNLNQSKKSITWESKRPFQFAPLSFITIHIYKQKPYSQSGYVADVYANILRQSLGLAIYSIWFHFIYSAFKPNLIYLSWYNPDFQYFVYLLLIIPFLVYSYYRRKLSRLKSTKEERQAIYKRTGILSVVFFMLSLVLLLFTLVYGNLFSPFGMIILLLTTYSMMLYYVFFRLVRPRLFHVLRSVKSANLNRTAIVLNRITFFSKPTSFLAFFIISFISCFLLIIYFNIAGLNDVMLPNGILIVLIYVFFYFYIIAAIGKYYFVRLSIADDLKKKGENGGLDSFKFKASTTSLIIISACFVLGFFFESNQNELEIQQLNGHKPTTLTQFCEQFDNNADTVFFVASHGGGLKANAWTLNVLNELDSLSDGKFMSQTVALSGASGGSLGLALYGNILGEKKGDPTLVSKTIDVIQSGNHASADVALVFGFDFLRSFFPLNMCVRTKNRSYMSMLKYQNQIRDSFTLNLDKNDFRTFWGDINYNEKKLPALIMNTASTRGKRGIFFSLKTPHYDSIFPFSENLADLENFLGTRSSLSFYNAVSTTNRFPVFSPAAKIKGVGHFIDAGAIDNSGLLGCWDLYLYLRRKGVFQNKVIVFVEIINAKSNYAEHLLKDFIQQNPELLFKRDEWEKTSIVANLETGLNLNKIPGYLEGFMANYSFHRNDLDYKQIYLPHKISIEDVENVINAEITEGDFYDQLELFLKKHNQQILHATDRQIGFTDTWKYYEPVLSRQLSKSNRSYYKIMKNHELSGTHSLEKYFSK